MCGRFSIKASWSELRAYYDLVGPARNLPARYNIAPTQDVAAVRLNAAGGCELVMLRWGLIPGWAKDEKIGYRTINARAETVAEKPSYRAALARRRCLIPATGFYEWQKRDGVKQPYNVGMADGGLFSLAGLWERWEKGGAPVESFTIVTTEANDCVRPIHDRMPVILGPADHAAWLDAAATDAGAARSLLRPFPAERMTAWPVSTHVNRPANDDPECLAPAAPG